MAMALQPDAESALACEGNWRQWLDVQGKAIAPTLREQLASQPLHRLQQYRYMVQANLQETMELVYPYTRQLCAELWQDAFSAYLMAFPPTSYLLHGCVSNFPAFLRACHEAEQAWLAPVSADVLAFLPDLAAYELAEANVLRALAAPLPASVSTELPDSLMSWAPVLNPAHELLSSAYPIHEVVASVQQKAPQEQWLPINAKLTHLWIYRDNDYRARFYQVNALVLAFLQQVKAGAQPQSYFTHLAQVLGADQAQAPSAQGQFLGLLQTLLEAQLLLGSQPVNEQSQVVDEPVPA